jgi:hypothetical protein
MQERGGQNWNEWQQKSEGPLFRLRHTSWLRSRSACAVAPVLHLDLQVLGAFEQLVLHGLQSGSFG